jgi:hypothetical protein
MNVVRRVKPTQDWAHEAKERVATYQPGGALVGYIVVGRSTEGDMSHGVHAVQHEVEHQIEHEEHGHGAGRRKSLAESANKRIALLISVLAPFLAFSETLGKRARKWPHLPDRSAPQGHHQCHSSPATRRRSEAQWLRAAPPVASDNNSSG